MVELKLMLNLLYKATYQEKMVVLLLIQWPQGQESNEFHSMVMVFWIHESSVMMGIRLMVMDVIIQVKLNNQHVQLLHNLLRAQNRLLFLYNELRQIDEFSKMQIDEMEELQICDMCHHFLFHVHTHIVEQLEHDLQIILIHLVL